MLEMLIVLFFKLFGEIWLLCVVLVKWVILFVIFIMFFDWYDLMFGMSKLILELIVILMLWLLK